ncbi:hypothetical protein [Streptomyces sp. NPDC006012]|uniref:hypothetical protein n=1 Tax=Streptomyces sp. NPDC006012 TaxID=3364739 RepID=UPI0036785967
MTAEQNPRRIPIPTDLVVMQSQEDGSALLPAHQVTALMRSLSAALRKHPEIEPADGLDALADQLDLVVLAALDRLAQGDS